MQRWVGLGASAGLMLLACSGPDVAPPLTASELDAAELGQLFSSVSEACPNLSAPATAAGASDEIFVEAVVVDVPAELAKELSPRQLPELARSPRVELVAAPHMLGPFEREVQAALGPASDSSRLSLARWSMVARHVDELDSVLELELELRQLERRGSEPSSKTLRFSVTTRNNQPSLARLAWDDTGTRSLVLALRSFRVHGEAELRAIFECKMQQRARDLQRVRLPTRSTTG